MPHPAADLCFLDAKPYTHSDAVVRSIKTKTLRPPLVAFLSNINRLRRLQELPPDITTLAAHYAVALDKMRGMDTDGADPLAVAAIWTRIRSQLDPTLSEYRDNAEYLLRKIIENTEGVLTPALEAVLTTQITGAWTACEVLLGDLWEAALNHHPSTLANLPGKAKEPKPDTPEFTKEKQQEKQPSKQQGVSITVDVVSSHGFDVRNKMGTILRKKFGFKFLDEVIYAYYRAFEDKNVRDAIGDDSLLHLSALRHVIIHKAGVADKEFTDQVCAHGTLKSYTRDMPITIDGPLVLSLVKPAITTILELIRAVDDWMVRHP